MGLLFKRNLYQARYCYSIVLKTFGASWVLGWSQIFGWHEQIYAVNSLYNHAHFSHILVCVTQFLVNHAFQFETSIFRITITLINRTKYL
jgi:hypothetical protein